MFSLSPVFCCRAGSGYPLHGYPILGNSLGGFPLPSSRFVIRVPSPRWICPQRLSGLYLPQFGIGAFSPRHCLSAASLSGATLQSILEGVPLSASSQPGDAGGRRNAPAVCQFHISRPQMSWGLIGIYHAQFSVA